MIRQLLTTLITTTFMITACEPSFVSETVSEAVDEPVVSNKNINPNSVKSSYYVLLKYKEKLETIETDAVK